MGFDFVKSYALIEASRAAARRERSRYIHCLLLRAKLWLLARLRGGVISQGPCCEPA